jgi:hypothetical protein
MPLVHIGLAPMLRSASNLTIRVSEYTILSGTVEREVTSDLPNNRRLCDHLRGRDCGGALRPGVAGATTGLQLCDRSAVGALGDSDC